MKRAIAIGAALLALVGLLAWRITTGNAVLSIEGPLSNSLTHLITRSVGEAQGEELVGGVGQGDSFVAIRSDGNGFYWSDFLNPYSAGSFWTEFTDWQLVAVRWNDGKVAAAFRRRAAPKSGHEMESCAAWYSVAGGKMALAAAKSWDGYVWAVESFDDSKTLASVDFDGVLRLHHFEENPSAAITFDLSADKSEKGGAVTAVPGSRTVLCGVGTKLHVYEGQPDGSFKPARQIEMPSQIAALAVSDDREHRYLTVLLGPIVSPESIAVYDLKEDEIVNQFSITDVEHIPPHDFVIRGDRIWAFAYRRRSPTSTQKLLQPGVQQLDRVLQCWPVKQQAQEPLLTISGDVNAASVWTTNTGETRIAIVDDASIMIYQLD